MEPPSMAKKCDDDGNKFWGNYPMTSDRVMILV